MKGSLKEGPALFQLISRAVGTYRLQLHLASMAGIATTGVMARLRIALYSLWTALGPIGWITIALSLLVSAGIWVYQNWEKVKHYGLQAWGALKVGIGYYVMGIIKLYKFLLGWIPGLGKVFDNLAKKIASFVSREKSIMASRKSTYADANKPVNEMTKKQQELLNAAQDSMGAINDQGDAIKDAGKKTKKAGKEAKGGLAGFDEIHQVMQQTADAADDVAGGVGGLGDVGDLGDIGGLGDLGDLGNLGGIGDFGQVEEQTSILGSLWDGVKKKWGDFKEWAGGLWDGVKEKWNNFKEWVKGWDIWTWIGEKWNNFKIWAGDFWSSVQTKWNNFRNWAAEKWNTFFDPIREKWNNFKLWAGELWSSIQTKWNNFKTWVAERWNTFFNPIKEKWNNFKTWVNGFWETPKTKWNQAINWMKEKVKSIRDAFNFKWSLPRIKLPHFYVTWSTSGFWGKVGDFLGLPGKPILGVNWYAEGGIFNQPSIIGVGEAGAEAVVPLDRLTELFASALRQVLSEARPAVAGAGGGDITIPIYIGNELLETIIVKAQDRRNTRSNGR